ncbi:OTU2 [Candida pseudojiufengensis]|uniref:OTU2 n=1 Tax=Candida pseudojiufengensis TaxID=497109 RepID=UPI002225A419|nr:OTU2 [Candida pseudojiufengensis]KAI5964194.1 OTU2 [Candida pseudojiufengensis]
MSTEEPKTVDVSSTTLDDILQRHKKENKDLIATITGLKKEATKKTRKNVLARCQELEDNLKRKHQEELSEFNNDETANTNEEDEVTPEQLLAQLSVEENDEQSDDKSKAPSKAPEGTTGSSTGKKRNRAKERLIKRQQEIDRIKAEAEKESENSINYRQIEIDSMNKLLSLNDLKVYEIKPDGNCLFASIQNQLIERHNLVENEISIQKLRDLSSDYILENKNDFIPFLFDETTGEIKDIDEYCNELKITTMWGSDMEILALSKIFECCIIIHQAGASSIEINKDTVYDDPKPTLHLGYYKHSYGLGEHYNSLLDS